MRSRQPGEEVSAVLVAADMVRVKCDFDDRLFKGYW